MVTDHITATWAAVKQCPFVDELDVGLVTFTWALGQGTDVGPDLHRVRASVDDYSAMKMTHEEFTQRLAEFWGCRVESSWRTAGADVKVVRDYTPR